MELITRTIIRERDGREVPYKFQTYDFIFHPRAASKPTFERMRSFLLEAFMYGPPRNPKSPSDERGLVLEVKPSIGSVEDLCVKASAANYHGRGAGQHQCVQDYFMMNDQYTVATEVPVWDADYTGSIDILRYFPEVDTIQILDFKPNAKKEKHVSGQLFKYAELFHDNAGIPFWNIELLYFDDTDAYQIIF